MVFLARVHLRITHVRRGRVEPRRQQQQLGREGAKSRYDTLRERRSPFETARAANPRRLTTRAAAGLGGLTPPYRRDRHVDHISEESIGRSGRGVESGDGRVAGVV